MGPALGWHSCMGSVWEAVWDLYGICMGSGGAAGSSFLLLLLPMNLPCSDQRPRAPGGGLGPIPAPYGAAEPSAPQGAPMGREGLLGPRLAPPEGPKSGGFWEFSAHPGSAEPFLAFREGSSLPPPLVVSSPDSCWKNPKSLWIRPDNRRFLAAAESSPNPARILPKAPQSQAGAGCSGSRRWCCGNLVGWGRPYSLHTSVEWPRK